MGYLHPPPGDGPVIVMKDVGGDVHQYAAQTHAYISSGREVRLHECRSACTLALAVPNVCVYPNSVLRFHKAYNPFTKATNDSISDAMMAAYPPAVRARLGVLTRQYKSLTGSELIRLGVRDCDAPAQPRILVARANVHPTSQNPLSNAFSGLFAGLGTSDIPVYGAYGAPVKVQRVKVQVAEATPAPADRTQVAVPVADAATPPAPELAPNLAPNLAPEPTDAAVAPVPPPRPPDLAAAPEPPPADVPTPPYRPLAPPAARTARASTAAWGVPIRGSAPTLASARFAPFPYRLSRGA
ncbi:MAG TPA: hypothetical protein VMU18_11725 [Rhodoblastus sp.]|nr:hypothetical protein [Rhodoblastus sp.]